MFQFEWPWMGLFLLLPIALWLRNRTKQHLDEEQSARRVTLLHPALANLKESFSGKKPSPAASALFYRLLLSLLWIAMTLALMRPQWLHVHQEERIEGYDLMLVVDSSRSMEALDFSVGGRQVSRMAVVKGVMDKFIAGRENDRIGLIAFGSNAFMLSPLTLDRLAVRQLLETLVPRVAGDATAIGDAIGLGVKKLRERPEGSRVLVLIADGENTSGTIPPLEAARLAAREGVRIYAIGVGSDQEQVPVMENGQITYHSDYGFDEQAMQDIALTTGGSYFRATDTQALESISDQINDLAKSKVDARVLMIPEPLYRWPLGAVLLALLMLGLFPKGRARKLGKAVESE